MYTAYPLSDAGVVLGYLESVVVSEGTGAIGERALQQKR
jgi:hypothetical protein